MERTDICSCNICTSTIHGGRIPQKARKAVRLCTGSTVYRKEPWMAVRICPGMDGIPQGARKAVWLCLLYFSISFVYAPQILAGSACTSEQFDETSKIRYIHDGDTLRLNDGRKIRLIGINTPELAHDGKPAEAFAFEAKNALKSLFKKDKAIALVYGKDKKDRYGRLLAHAFLTDGQNVQATLLKQGYANAITMPPNTLFASCYLEMENKARCNKKGLWKNTVILQAKNLNNQHTGFRLVKGKVESINSNSKGIWLNLDNKLTIGIRPDN
ncbi:MAG: hypothetical protein GQ573_02935, partial [Gammaproteobacteria bacterium]|nr:hypothetical protein [Gammaproteobacteria bacterium]